VVRLISDTVSVLHHGKQVDSGPVERVFRTPTSDYTRELILAIPGRARPRRNVSSFEPAE
jgi:peptide/nickel transport system ATP-binding protein